MSRDRRPLPDCYLMNPICWKREHQIALMLAAGIGAIIGWWLFGQRIQECWFLHDSDVYEFGPLGECWFDLFEGPVMGAFAGGAIAYVCQMLSTSKSN